MPADRDWVDRSLADRAACAYAASARSHPGLGRRGALDEGGGLMRRATGSPVPYFSWLYVTSDDVDDAALVDAVDWFDRREQPFTIRLREHQVQRYAATLGDLGFTADLVMPGMVCAPLPSPGADVATLAITKVHDHETCDVFTAQVAPGVPGHWLTTDTYRDFMTAEMVDDSASAYFIGVLDGRPVATAGARVDAGVVVVFAVTTAEPFRRQGIGRAMTQAALEWARPLGVDLAFLTSSDMAVTLYESMGFRTVDTWHFYLRPWAATGG